VAQIGSAKLSVMRHLAIAVVLIAVVGCGSDESSTDSPAFLGGGRDAFETFVEKQRGTPVVVNKWASWCGPCRAEFPFLRDQANKRKGKVVFVGVNSQDNDGDARDFLDEYPVPFRHFKDPKLEVAASFNGVQAFPTTAYYDSKGELAFVHQGGYASEADLAEDIDQYAR
jgi:cytochrome c biogenesis protein CcmG/thiol:disulfide interchange protein DsbE